MTPSTAEVRPKWLKMDKSSSIDSVIPSQEGNLKTTERWELRGGGGEESGFLQSKGRPVEESKQKSDTVWFIFLKDPAWQWFA